MTCTFLLCDKVHFVFVVRLINWNFLFDLVREVFCFLTIFVCIFDLWVTLKSIHPLFFSFVTVKLSTLYLFQHLNKMFIRAVFVCGYIFFSVWRLGGESCMFHFLFLFIYCDLSLDGRNSEHLSLFGKGMAWPGSEDCRGIGMFICWLCVKKIVRLCVAASPSENKMAKKHICAG